MSNATGRRGFLTVVLSSVGCAMNRTTVRPGDSGIVELEREHGGRLGVVVLDARGGMRLAHRPDERVAMCSTFKTLLVAAVLRRIDEGRVPHLGETISYGPNALLEHSPISRRNLARGGMTVAELCEAAITVSDNTAANLLLDALGGPAELTRYLRLLGDPVTRLNRIEPALNDVPDGDERDTTTPRAMAEDLRRLFLGDELPSPARTRLINWHRATTTGPARLRAGLPSDWTLAHKTGSGERGVTNDVGVTWPREGAPLVIAAFYRSSDTPLDGREAVLAKAAQMAARRA